MSDRHQQERRLHARRSCRLKVVFEDEYGEGLFFVHSHDLSEGGMALDADLPLRVGAMLMLSFDLPGDGRVRVTGRVTRWPGNGRMGVRFVGLSREQLARVRAFLHT